MKFEVVYKFNNQAMMSTTFESCIPFEHLTSLEKAGHIFRIDGKKVSISEIRSRFKHLAEAKEVSDSTEAPTVNIPPAPSTRKVRSIRCVNNGKEYRNMSEAGKDLGLDSALISYSLKVGRPTKGYSFEFVD